MRTIPKAHKEIIKEILNININKNQYLDLLQFIDMYYPSIYFNDSSYELLNYIINNWYDTYKKSS